MKYSTTANQLLKFKSKNQCRSTQASGSTPSLRLRAKAIRFPSRLHPIWWSNLHRKRTMSIHVAATTWSLLFRCR